MSVKRCRVGVLTSQLQAQAALLTEALQRAGWQVLAPGLDSPADLHLWLVTAADRSALAESLTAAQAAQRGGLHWLVAADADLATLLPLPHVADALALPLREGDLRWRLQRAAQRSAVAAAAPWPGIVGQAPKLLAALALLRRFADCSAGVLVLGETGTGKELFAQALHRQSPRAAGPFVALNCAALPADLIESELFGHAKGAYTSAAGARPGLVEAAEGGTLFLDDVDGLPPAAQAKLLRFLQEHEYRRVGCNTLRRAQVRVVAASNCNLAQLVAQGQFRADLFYRLNVLTLALPPLRERKEDLPALAAHVLGSSHTLLPAALLRLQQYAWPGNVRELGHVLQRAQLVCEGTAIGPEDLALGGDAPAAAMEAPAPVAAAGGASLRDAKQRFERDWIDQLLRSHQGNVTRAAAAARKDRRAFIALMRKHAIESAPYRTQGAQATLSASSVGV